MGYNMKKYIKTNGNKIVEVRPEMFEGFTEVEVEDSINDIQLMRQYYYQNNNLVKTDEIVNKRNLQEEYFEIRAWLSQNDYKINKVFLGEWETTDKRWTDYLEERKVKRARLDEIRQVIGG